MTEPIAMNQGLLRKALLGNATFSILSAAIITFYKNSLTGWLGISKDFDLLFLAIGLAIFAAWLLMNAGRKQIKVVEARIAVVMDIVWVALSIPVVIFAPLSSQGKWIVAVVAEIVLTFALFQWIGIRRITGDINRKTQAVRHM